MTGHFVLSTLHTNDAISSATRLLDIGIEGYLAAAALKGVLSQRLVRKICPHCSTAFQPDLQQQIWLELMAEQQYCQANPQGLRQGQGCTSCNNTGYTGRVGIFELLEIDEAMAEALRHGDSSGFAAAAKNSRDYRPLVASALALAEQGITSLEEVLRVTAEDAHVTMEESAS